MEKHLMRIGLILGTRPEMIKLGPVYRSLRERGHHVALVHTGQHFDPAMSAHIWSAAGLPVPDVQLSLGGQLRVSQFVIGLEALTAALPALDLDGVVVQGDTNSVAIASLAAHELGLPIAHVEAGLRCFDRTMPEELNRVIADHLAHVHFVPTPLQETFLRNEGIAGDTVCVVGNTVADTLLGKRASRRAAASILLTLHRPANVDDPARLHTWLEALNAVAQELETTLLFPMHPRTRAHVSILSYPRLRVCDPLSSYDFLQRLLEAPLVMTDSGGVQEEACIVGVPCITLRVSTERQETVALGANTLVGEPDVDRLITACRTALTSSAQWQHPYGDGHTGEAIVQHLESVW